jgi:hypothetical protein
MLKVKEKEPYIILPKQRYNLSTYEPHSVMNGDFTLFVDFQLDSKAYDAEYAIIARPGMHMGIMIKKIKPDYSLLCWDYWTVGIDGQYKWNSIHIELFANQNITPNDRYFVFIQHTVGERHFKAYINSAKFKEPIVLEQKYEGKLVDYSETPYNIGCGNYSKVVPKRDRLFTACTIYKLGLIGTNDYTYEQIIKFLDATKDDVTNLSKTLFDIVFYFNFNLTNIYKIWDLSGHCNFMQKNLYIEDEETYLTDDDFYEDYANK